MRKHGSYAALIALLIAPLFVAVLLVPGRARGEEPSSKDSNDYSTLMISGGSGIMEFAHGEVAYFLNRRVTLEAQYKWAFHNHMVGLGATGYYSGFARPDGPPEFSLLAGGSLLVNPTLDRLPLASTDDHIASAAVLYHGWAWNSDPGFMVRILGGGLIFERNGPKASPLVNMSVGYIF